MTIVTLTVDGPEDLVTTVHAAEDAALQAFHDNYAAPDDPGYGDPVAFLDWATERGGYVVYIETHAVPGKEES